MLRKLGISNFKGFDEKGVSLELGRISVFVGSNGTGKSSVLQALMLLRQSSGSAALQTSSPFIDLGGFGDIVHDGDALRTVRLSVVCDYEYDLRQLPPSEWELPATGEYRYELESGLQGLINHVAYIGSEGHQFSMHWRAGTTSTQSKTAYWTLGPALGRIVVAPSNAIARPIAIVSTEAPNDSSVLPAAVQELDRLLGTLDRSLRRCFLVPALRGFDSLTYPTFQNLDQVPLGPVGFPESQAAFAVNLLGRRPELQESLAEALRKVLGRDDLRLVLRLAENQRVAIDVGDQRGRRNVVNEAFGLNQLIVPLLWIVSTEAESVIAMEEPENHLHPRAQAALCDALVDLVEEGNKQLILSSHSEHILMALLTAVADGRLTPDELAVYEFRSDGYASTAERRAVSDDGRVQGGLKGFLEADVERMGELIDARLDRSKP